jgi:outer membrane cobalamin receptor
MTGRYSYIRLCIRCSASQLSLPILCLIFLFVTAPSALSAQDSLNVKTRDSVLNLPAVEVAAPRIQTTPTRPATRIDRANIERLPVQDLGDIISLSPGVFVKSYGGLGGVQTLSLRGSTAPQTLVLLDGVRLNSVSNAVVDLALLPPALVEDVQIVRGGAAALYGANALGGVVDIRSRRLPAPLMFGGSLERASFNEWRLAAYGGGRHAKLQFSAAMALDQSDGDYAFKFNQFGEDQIARRVNGDALIRAGMINLQWLDASWRAFSSVLLRDAERGSPGAVVQGNIEDVSARLFDDDIAVIAGLDYVNTQWHSSLLFNIRRANQRYRDPEFFGADPTFNTFHFRECEVAAVWQSAVQIADYSLESRLEYSYATLNGDQLQDLAEDRALRRHAGLAVNASREIPLTPDQILRVETALRLDAYVEFPSVLSPLFALAWTYKPYGLSLRTQVSDNYRPPSFNELYYLNYGSRDLQAERAVSIGLGAVLQCHNFNITLDYFRFWTRDQIVAVPRSPIAWSARNVGRVTGQGLELAVEGSILNDHMQLRLAATLQQAVDESPMSLSRGQDIVYVPQQLLNASLLWAAGIIDCGLLFEFTGGRATLPGDGDDSSLAAYNLFNVFVAYDFELEPVQLTTRLQLNNVFDADYSVVRNYPMPGRRIALSLKFATGK